MNRIFSVVWSRALRAWVVTNEHAVRRGRPGAGRTSTSRAGQPEAGRGSRHALPLRSALCLALGAAGPLHAADLPTGGEIVLGSGQIGTPAANHMIIDQSSGKLAINWQSFDIGAGNRVTFRQPGSDAIALNRVLGSDGSKILGQLDANGRVFLINPNGILFGSGAQVSVGALVASTLDLSNDDFAAGRYRFSSSGTPAAVINQGTLSAADGGAVALLGGKVSNQGVISARLGTVALAAGKEITLDFAGDGLLNVQVDQGVAEALVENRQLIAADGGTVILTAQASDALLRTVVNNTGVIEAQTVGEREGKILLLAGMDDGVVHAGGTLDASAPDGGNGGFIETSAATVTLLDGLKVSTLAASGTTGTWLIDPYDITISASSSSSVSVNAGGSPWQVTPTGTSSNINNTTLSAYLSSSNVTISTVGAGSAAGNITVTAPVNWSAATTLTLNADSTTGGIYLGANITGSNAASGLVLNAGAGGISQSVGAITVGTLTANTSNGGSVALTLSGNAIATLAASSAAGSFSLLNGGALTVSGAISSNGTTTIGTTSGNLTIAAAQSDSHANASLTLSAGGELIIKKDITQSGSNAALVLNHGSGYSLRDGARVTLSDAGSSLSINSIAYTLIRDLAGLQAVGGSGLYALATDIDASASAGWDAGAGFAPISSFSGTVAGLGHTIDSLVINRPAASQTGLFGTTAGAVLRDLTLSNVSVTGAARVGALVGNASNTAVSNVHVTGSVSGYQEVGGVAGWFSDSSLRDSSSSASVSASYNTAGGLIGYGYYGIDISDAYATGPVTAAGSEAGGLFGRVAEVTLTLNKVYASGAVSAASSTGGLIGIANGSNTVTALSAYWDVDSTGQAGSAGAYGTGIANANAYTQATYGGFDFTNTWVMLPGSTRPMLRSEYSTTVYTPHALQLMALDLAASYRLGTDLDLNPSFTANGGYYGDVWNSAGFSPIGSNASHFTGSFDGQGHTLSGLFINRGGANYIGLFGYAQGAAIQNLALLGGSLTANSNVGALVGYMAGGYLGNASSSATVSSISTGESNTGGLVGTNDGGTISDASASGDVTGAGYQVGGLVGYNVNGGLIRRSYANGDVIGTASASGYIGGLVGANGYTGNNGGTITQSYATGTVTGAAGPIGGLVGHNEGSISDSYAMGSVIGTGSATSIGGLVGVNFVNGTIATSYATGYVSGNLTGGLVGYNNSTSGAILQSYWNIQTSGQSSGVGGGVGSATARTTAQLQGSLPAGFSSSIWGVGSNLYPYFSWNYSTTPIAISGTAYGSAGGSALAGATVTAISGGGVIGSASSGANGYYYILGTADTLDANGALSYLDGHATQGAAYADTVGLNGVQGMDIYGNAVHFIAGKSSLSATRSAYVAARGAYADSDLSFLSTSSLTPLTSAGYGVYLDASGSYLLDASLDSGGALSLASGGGFSLSGSRTLSAGGTLTLHDTVSWSDASTLTLSTSGGNAIVVDGAITAANGTLALDAPAAGIGATAAIAVGVFDLQGGHWSQLSANLPSFSAGDFRLGSGTTFLRASGGDGSTATPYLIEDVYGLQGMASTNLLADHFALAADIAASGTAGWNGGAGFNPIGTSGTPFSGSLDGQGHTIGGLTINRAATNGIGLFGVTQGATIRDLGLVGGNIAGANRVGALVGFMQYGSLSGSFATSSVSGDALVGGLVGLNGLAGSGGTISTSYAAGAVSAATGAAGGFVGGNAGIIMDAYATGTVSGGDSVGGFVGTADSGNISRAYATGAVSGGTQLGGFAGNVQAGAVNTGSFWNTDSTGLLSATGAGSSAGITGLTSAQMRSLATYAGWSIDDAGGTGSVWRIYDGYTAPLLRTFLTSLTVTGGNGSKTYDGTAASTDVGNLSYSPGGYDSSLLLGSASYATASANAGSYSGGTLSLDGLYSTQRGYDITLVAGSFVITPKAITVTANSGSSSFGGGGLANPGLSASGLIAGEDVSVLTGLSNSFGITAATPAGTYTLTVNGSLTNGNYTLSQRVDGSWTVTDGAPLDLPAYAEAVASTSQSDRRHPPPLATADAGATPPLYEIVAGGLRLPGCAGAPDSQCAQGAR
ncbi:filamentous hemagglutinin N-terminal domain-containing protein [Azoarcus sp. TTM-91]|uniref:two-partner secretion domain-containing protein n=1 Tax=Azoarcus sp. TTM-91 TaxID=2691581 RepID=UPI00145D851B|nr:filamentous hemagglutinin N-terminal domain-containing protein [Azoarcus sp. TTM-91]NMG36880.1 filamentous hemagglutinin N-terminal domain-containing protein [Azoarcus sp. TTM-91]